MEREQIDDLNTGFVEELFAEYLASPESVDPEWRALFEQNPDGAVEHLPLVQRLRELYPEACPAGTALPVAAARSRATEAAPDRRCSAASPRRWRSSRRTGCTAISPRASIRSAPSRPAIPRSIPDRLDPQLTPELQARIPAQRPPPATCRATRSSRCCRVLRETYCGTMAYEIEHISNHEQRVWLRQAIESGAYRRPLSPDEKKAPPRAPLRGRGLRALPAPRVPRPEAVLDRRPRRDGPDARRDDRAGGRAGARRRRARHGAPRPAQRPRPHARPAVRRRSCASSRASACSTRSRTTPRSGTGDVKYHLGAEGVRADAERRGARSCSRRTRAISRWSTRSSRARRAPRRPITRAPAGEHDPTAALRDPHPRRRGLPRPGHRRRDAQPPGARRLRDRRHAPHRREQPGRLHDRPGRGPLDPLLERPGQGLRRADRPRERRRSRGGDRGDPARDGLPGALPARRRRRPRRLPALRPQRGRRAGVHAAAHVRS